MLGAHLENPEDAVCTGTGESEKVDSDARSHVYV